MGALVLGMLPACSSCLFALNPSLDISQYAHNAWKISEGFFKGSPRSLAQTPDGYLWVGTEFGLLRFDGVRSVPWQPPPGEHLGNTDIRSLCAARDGRLWIGTFDGLASWKDGKLTHYRELDGQVIEGLLEDREGTVWVAGWAPSTGRLCSIRNGQTQCYGEDGRFASGVTPLFEDSRGDLWAGAANGLWLWRPGPSRLYPMPDPAKRIYALAESDDGGILAAKLSGITKFRDGKTEPYPTPAGSARKPYRLLKDRDGGLWIGDVVDGGLAHIHQGRTDFFSRSDGLSGSSVSSLLQDREGSIWVGTTEGLDRFRDFAVSTISVAQGLSSHGVFSVLTAKDGSLWLGMSDGLNRWNQGGITVYHKRRTDNPRSDSPGVSAGRPPLREIVVDRLPDTSFECLFEDDRGHIWVGTQGGVGFLQSDRFVPIPFVPPGVAYSMATDRTGAIWMSHQEGLFRLSQSTVAERFPWSALGRAQPATVLAPDPAKEGLWLGFRDGGVAHFKDGRLVASYGRADGLGEGMVRGLYIDGGSILWAATDGGLSRIHDGHILTLTSRNGLPCNTVHWMMEDDAHAVWLYLACGLARIPRTELDAWVSHHKQSIQAAIFDSSDGVSNHLYTGGYGAVVAKAADRKLWFLRVGGVGVIDPDHLAINPLPPPVRIESLTVNGKPHELRAGMRLPPGVRDLSIDYTALSFVAPEKVHFRYKLEGQDTDWKEVVNDRQAEYTNLAPKKYVFRVTACNNSGVWNKEGDTLEFSVAPAYYQTDFFRLTCAAVFLASLWGLYRLRLYQVQREFNAQLDGRVDERLRVARDLHDTMLQTSQAALIQMQAAYNLLSRGPEQAGEALHKAITTSAGAIAQGRDAIQNMRSSTEVTNDLARALRLAGDHLATHRSARFDVRVQGSSLDLHPILRDEVYRIALEALRNAFQHADAKAIEAEIVYGDSLRVRIRDNGKGIDPVVIEQGRRSGHYGLSGMRERAENIGGKLDIWTGPGNGTEIQLTVPGNIAFGRSGGSFLFRRFRRNSKSATAES